MYTSVLDAECDAKCDAVYRKITEPPLFTNYEKTYCCTKGLLITTGKQNLALNDPTNIATEILLYYTYKLQTFKLSKL